MLLQTIFVYVTFMLLLYSCGRASFASASISTEAGNNNAKFWTPPMIIMLLGFSLLVGMRYDVGTDHLHYWAIYENGYINERMEPLFNLIMDVCLKLSLPPTFFFGVLGFIQVTFFYLAFRDERYLYPLFAIFLFTNGLFGSWMNTIRQDIAGCIWLFSFRYIDEKKIKLYLIWCVIACLFHRSAVILFLMYPLLRIKKDWLSNVTLQMIIVLVALVFKKYFNLLFYQLDTLSSYYLNILSIGMEEDHFNSYSLDNLVVGAGHFNEVLQSGIGVIVKDITYIIIVLFSNKIKSFYNSQRVNNYYIVFYLAFILYIILPTGVYSLARPFQYFTTVLTVMIAYAVYYFFHEKKSDYSILGILLILLQILLFFGSMFMASSSSSRNGYQFFFQQ